MRDVGVRHTPEVTRKLLVVEIPDNVDFRGRPSLGIIVRGELPTAEELGRVASAAYADVMHMSNPKLVYDHVGQAILDALTKGKP